MDKHRADKLDHLFREKLQDHEISPKEDYWPYMEKSLNKIAFYKFGWGHINIYNISIGVVLISIPVLYFLFQSKEETILPVEPSKTKTEIITEPTSDAGDQQKPVQEISKTGKKDLNRTPKTEKVKDVGTADLQPKDSLPVIVPEEKIIPIETEPAKIVEEKPKPKPKKIIYVVQQDTIIEKDTVKVRRKKKN